LQYEEEIEVSKNKDKLEVKRYRAREEALKDAERAMKMNPAEVMRANWFRARVSNLFISFF
jgi:hypothetical protein